MTPKTCYLRGRVIVRKRKKGERELERKNLRKATL